MHVLEQAADLVGVPEEFREEIFARVGGSVVASAADMMHELLMDRKQAKAGDGRNATAPWPERAERLYA